LFETQMFMFNNNIKKRERGKRALRVLFNKIIIIIANNINNNSV